MDILLDLIILGIIIICALIGYYRGLLRSLFGLVSFGFAIVLAINIFPRLAMWLREETPMYIGLKDYIIRNMGLEGVVQEHTYEIIRTLPLPDLLIRSLLQYDTPNMYELLNIQTIEEYIASYFAGLAVNIISVILVFIFVWLVMRIIASMLDLVGRLPVIRVFNHGGGLIFGFFQGVLIVWIGLIIINLFFLDPNRPEAYSLLNESLFAGIIYEYNPIMRILASINNWFFDMYF